MPKQDWSCCILDGKSLYLLQVRLDLLFTDLWALDLAIAVIDQHILLATVWRFNMLHLSSSSLFKYTQIIINAQDMKVPLD